MTGLTPKQLAFVHAYLHGDEEGRGRFNATKAAIAAGYAEKTAPARGSEMRKQPQVAARISEELANRALAPDAVLAELADVATSEWREHLQIRIDSRTGEIADVKMDLHAKMKALELMAKHHGLLTDNLNISGGIEVREYPGIPEDTP